MTPSAIESSFTMKTPGDNYEEAQACLGQLTDMKERLQELMIAISGNPPPKNYVLAAQRGCNNALAHLNAGIVKMQAEGWGTGVRPPSLDKPKRSRKAPK